MDNSVHPLFFYEGADDCRMIWDSMLRLKQGPLDISAVFLKNHGSKLLSFEPLKEA